MKCPKCGSDNPEYAVYCSMCSSTLAGPKARNSIPSGRGGFHKTESSLPFAGLLLVIAGLLALAQAWVVIQSNSSKVPFTMVAGDTADFYFGILWLFLGAVVIYGGVLTARRVSLNLSVLFAILAMMSWIGTIFGIISLLVIFRSRGDFKSRRSLDRTNFTVLQLRWEKFPRFLDLLAYPGALAFVVIASIGAYQFAFGLRDLGLFLLGLSGFLAGAAMLYVISLERASTTKVQSRGIGSGRRSLDLLVGRNLTLASVILALAGGVFFIADGEVPYYYDSIQLSMETHLWGGLSLTLGTVAFLGYALQSAKRYFTLGLICTIAAPISAFWAIGILGGVVGIGATFFVVISKGEFQD